MTFRAVEIRLEATAETVCWGDISPLVYTDADLNWREQANARFQDDRVSKRASATMNSSRTAVDDIGVYEDITENRKSEPVQSHS
jgi:hypothetical protein